MRSPFRLSVATAILAVAAAVVAPRASSEVIYSTQGPFGGPFGLIGFDVFENQSVGIRFTPSARYSLDRIGVWFMNNDFGGTVFDTVTMTLRNDGTSENGRSIPGTTIIESFSFQITAVGWDPQLETVTSVLHPVLEPGIDYWIVCVANVPAFTNPVWNWPRIGTGYTATTDFATGQWQDGGEGATATAIVEGARLFELSTNSPVMVGDDLTLQISLARPDTRTYLAFTLQGPGSTPVPRLGVTLGIIGPRRLGPPLRTDGLGGASFSVRVPPRAAGRTVWTQAAHLGGVSDVEVVIVQ